MRWVIARVLPVPAPASTHTGVVKWLATSRCSGSSAARISSASIGAAGAGVWSGAVIASHTASAGRQPGPACGPVRSALLAVAPVVDQGATEGGGAGQLDLSRLQRDLQLLAAEPAGLGDLVVLEGQLRRTGHPGAEAQHQRAREGPGLAAHVLHLLGVHADLLGDLPGDEIGRAHV